MSANPKLRRILTVLGTACFWLLVWYLIAVLVNQNVLIPTPWAVLCTMGTLVTKPLFWQSVGLTLLRVCIGFAAALAVGVLLAALTTRFSLLHTLFSPVLHIIRAAPVASFIIITLVWIVYDLVPAFISFLMVLPIVWINVSEGIRQTDTQLLEMASLFRLSTPISQSKTNSPHLPPVGETLFSHRRRQRIKFCLEIRCCGRSHLPSRFLHRTTTARSQTVYGDPASLCVDGRSGDFEFGAGTCLVAIDRNGTL